jgi:hypothetical protein
MFEYVASTKLRILPNMGHDAPMLRSIVAWSEIPRSLVSCKYPNIS